MFFPIFKKWHNLCSEFHVVRIAMFLFGAYFLIVQLASAFLVSSNCVHHTSTCKRILNFVRFRFAFRFFNDFFVDVFQDDETFSEAHCHDTWTHLHDVVRCDYFHRKVSSNNSIHQFSLFIASGVVLLGCWYLLPFANIVGVFTSKFRRLPIYMSIDNLLSRKEAHKRSFALFEQRSGTGFCVKVPICASLSVTAIRCCSFRTMVSL